MRIRSLTYHKIKKLLNNPQASAKELAEIVSKDHALSERLLKIVNSKYYGFPEKIESVTAAIVLLGFDAVKSMIGDQ